MNNYLDVPLLAERPDALRRAYGNLADALRQMAVPAIIIDEHGLVTAFNDSAARCFRLHDAYGRPLTDVLADWTGVGALLGAVAGPVRIAAGGRVLACEARALAPSSHADPEYSGSGADPVPSDHASFAPARPSSILTFVDVSEHVRLIENASRDALTGLVNRETLRSHLAGAVADGAGGALLCVDLDRFKTVNDTLGHPVGDALLVKIADRLRRAVRSGDVVARLGGDEFAVIQAPGPQGPATDGPSAELQRSELLAARLVGLLGRTYVVNGHMINVGASVGVARLGADGADAETLMRNADLALYQAKADGRGTYRVFEPAMDERLQARRRLELDLRRALAFREFDLAYQPQVRASDKEIVGFEALLRWRNPGRGMVSPGEFIPLAEEIGLMPAIGEWVLRTACKEAATWQRPVSVAVNLSPVQFRDPNLAETILSALRNAGLPPTRLELEITEGALLRDTEAVVGILGRLAAMGVRTSMDDFGTGYSSLSYLQKFRFDRIKIDQSFVRQVGISADSTAIVRAVAALGASLGMKTTAEGVETLEQLAQIRAEGCTEIQGYLTGRPMAPAAVAALLAATQGGSE